MENEYILVKWPESQELIEEPWFEEECSLADERLFGSAAYFVPKNRIK